MQNVSVRAVASRLKSQFNIDMEIDLVVQACSDALRKMGMIALSRKVIVAKVDNFCVNLPPDVWKVRGVVRLDAPDVFQRITLQNIHDQFPPQIVFVDQENNPNDTSPVLLKSNYVPQIKGPYINFVWTCPYVKFNETNINVGIEVTGLSIDEEGFPNIPEPAYFGCLYYALFVYYQPMFLAGQIDPNRFAQIEEWKDRNVGQANSKMMLESLNSNERDSLFNIMTSFDRKRFGIPI